MKRTKTQTQKKWYDNQILTNVLLLIFFPIGLYALWKSNTIAKWWKITASILIGIIVIGSLIEDDTISENSEKLTDEKQNFVLKTELPEEKKCKSELGVLKLDVNGHSVGKITEMTELKRMLKKEDCDIIEIIYEWKGSYRDNMPKKIIYNKRTGRLKDIFTRYNVIEDYKNVSPEGLMKFLDKGEKSFYLLSDYTDAEYDFNNREMTIESVGKQPYQNELNGSVPIVKDYIKDNSKDASSIRFIEGQR